MTQVLIVSKTRMHNRLCISGLTASNQNIRLKPIGLRNHPLDTPLEIGDIWEMELQEDQDVEPPHREDVFVMYQKYVGKVANIGSFLLKMIRPWVGEIDKLFDRNITVGYNKCYISKAGPIPQCSTGYWLPRQPLLLQKDPERENRYNYEVEYNYIFNGYPCKKNIIIPFVGLVHPTEKIHSSTLVRVSLARWFQASNTTEERCYLQISGWYE